ISAPSAAVQSILVHHGSRGGGAPGLEEDGADRVTVDVPLATGADLIKAQVALNQFKATASRDSKRSLSYAMVRTLRMRLHSPGIVGLAARLGLESTGVALPIAKSAKAIASPDGEPILVLVGTSHPLIDRLIAGKKWTRPTLEPGEGLIEVVRKAFGEKSAVI